MVTGPLTAADVGELEHACGPALTMRPLPLEIDLQAVPHTDYTAGTMLQTLAARGAVLIGMPSRLPQPPGRPIIPRKE